MCRMCDLSFVGFAMPQAQMLQSYIEALMAGWSPHTEVDISQQQLAAIDADPAAFLEKLADNQPPGQTRRLDDGRIVPVLPQRVRWIWDGDFCGQINLRWQPGTNALPEWVLGHIGYAVVPWKRDRDYAQRALRHMLGEAREVGLTHVDLSTPETNLASQRVIAINGGVLIDTSLSPLFGPTIRRQFHRIALA